MSWSWAALMPHPPIIVPEVGRGREREAAATREGVKQIMKKLVHRRPDCLFFLSPHQPYSTEALFVNGAARLNGTLAPFVAQLESVGPTISFDLKAAPEKELTAHLTQKGFSVRVKEAPNLTQDQGALVPLYFLRNAWKTALGLPPVLFASPIGLNPMTAFKLGEALTSFDNGMTWGLLASGDLSHRLTHSAPYGYSPAGKKFDASVVEALSSTDPQPLLTFPPEEVKAAGECGLRSVMVMLGLCQGAGKTIDVLSYEGPFGVGYCNAISEF